eukprot:scaffold15294_cov75-Skeletonema_dohrnii-CCMP3373.AAC.4
MDPPQEGTEEAGLPHHWRQRRRGALHVQWTLLLFTVSFVILSLFKLEPIARNSLQEHNVDNTPHDNEIGSLHLLNIANLDGTIGREALPSKGAVQLSRSPTSLTSFDSWEQDHCWRKREVGNRAAYKLLITGAGYSSTGFFASIFTKAGYPVGHEKFGKNSVGISDWLMSSRRNRHSPFKFNHIFLLVRHPLKVVHSEYGTQWNFIYTSTSGITSDVANDESLLGPEEFNKLAIEFKTLEWWLLYTLLGENIAECYIRNEDNQENEDISGELFLNMCLRSELPNCKTKDWASLINQSKKYNSHNSRTHDQVTWGDLESMVKTENENIVLRHARQVCLKFYSSKDC